MEVKIVKKAAIVCAMVLMISIVPAFALNSTTNNSTGVQVQNQSGTCDQTQKQTHDQTQAQNHAQDQNCQNNGNDGTKCTTCDGDQHKYQNGQNNAQTGTDNSEQQNKYQYQYGLKNSNTNNNCAEANCPNQS
jgi:hypothetical protein